MNNTQINGGIIRAHFIYVLFRKNSNPASRGSEIIKIAPMAIPNAIITYSISPPA